MEEDSVTMKWPGSEITQHLIGVEDHPASERVAYWRTSLMRDVKWVKETPTTRAATNLPPPQPVNAGGKGIRHAKLGAQRLVSRATACKRSAKRAANKLTFEAADAKGMKRRGRRGRPAQVAPDSAFVPVVAPGFVPIAAPALPQASSRVQVPQSSTTRLTEPAPFRSTRIAVESEAGFVDGCEIIINGGKGRVLPCNIIRTGPGLIEIDQPLYYPLPVGCLVTQVNYV